MPTVTRKHLCVVDRAFLDTRGEMNPDGTKSVTVQIMPIDEERVINVKRLAMGETPGGHLWAILLVTERTDIP